MLRNDLFDQSYYELYIDRLEAPDVRVIVSLSSGNASAVAGELALKAYGRERVDFVFADTLIEHTDNYRFLSELEARWGVKLTRLADGRDPYAVAEDEGIIPNDLLATCSYELKIKLVQERAQRLQDDGAVVIVVVGFDHKDARPRNKKPQGRLPDPRKRWAERNVFVWYPLLEKGILQFYVNTQTELPPVVDAAAVVASWGIKSPVMYEQGYSHANCAGTCVKQGLRDWRRTLIHNKDMFERVETWEAGMREFIARRQITRFLNAVIASDWKRAGRVNLKLYTLLDNGRTLEEMRLETEAADEQQLRMFEVRDDIDDRLCGVECMAA